MEYIFGTKTKFGNEKPILKTKGTKEEGHTNLTGYQTVNREYADRYITDTFKVVEKYHTDEDTEGNCYDWYYIENPYRDTDMFTPQKENIQGQLDYIAMMADIDLDTPDEEEV